MYLNCFDEIKHITKELVKIPSIVKTSGEADCAKWIYEYYKKLTYFKENPSQLKIIQTIDDEIERYIVVTHVKGTKGNSNKAVILMGHLDTVGVEDFGSIKEYAFNPERLLEHLKEMNLEEEVMEDINSGEYMFGRGVLDMKSGLAGHMYLTKYFSEHPEELNGHLITLAACDEEDNSHGILTALKVFKEMQEEGLEFIACINADYSTPYYKGDENRYVYFGTVGKLLPSFYVVGEEAHVGQVFSGLDPNLLVAELTRLMSYNPELCDISQGEVTVPPVSLKQSDFKEKYTVQTALTANSYYNFFTYSMTPKDVMNKMKQKGEEAFDNVIEYLNNSYRKFCEKADYPYRDLSWEKRVYAWDEFYNELHTIHGDRFKLYIDSFAKELNRENPELDLREFSVKIVEEAWKWSVDKSPAIIIYFSSTYSARIEITGETKLERNLIDSVNNSIEFVGKYSDKPIVTKMFYPYISDLSFMSLSDTPEDILYLEKNMPAWGSKYFYNVEDVMAMNVPIVNIGSYGKDGHKMTERVHMKHTFEIVPNITYNTVKTLLS
ncbi:arginine utilization protein RocB [Keratinibaculum paraultunense]|uniref:Arginine utilization protein RocB n=1 Tax=Keratinibaculum paraultunense TaxID=1278232 RepID=A0A4R3KZF4_9FIRM|nr:M20/M25/M40 family metallo-hydrolase [Keratinibaculum paraultunense]QQY79963.1 M20/M25/M40 family metallo-hydrolase [Keratinibaculum paraultunense]TCS91716.1 arginine utilization protein RocB [Keratinibaculum paraultunense]